MTCTNCGAELLAGTKFCRQCGRPTNNLAADAHEAPTRAFAPAEVPADRGAPTQYINAAPTGPAYISPEQTPPPFSSTPAQGLAPVWRKRQVLLASLIVIPLLAIVALTALLLLWGSTHRHPRQVVIAPGTIKPPIPPLPPKPPEPPGPPGNPQASAGAANNALIYPGAQIIMNITGGKKAGVLQLRTDDPVDKVIAWYTEKLKPTKNITTGKSAVLKANGATAIITGGDGGTTIMVTQSSNSSDEADDSDDDSDDSDD